MKTLKFLSLIVIAAIVLAACTPKTSSSASMTMPDGSAMKMASMDGMPAEVMQSAKSVQIAYQFAVANPDVLKHIPCYCGCGAAGHTSNYACYVKSDADSKVTYDLHATGCSICVDITRDTMNMLQEGKPVADIKAAIDKTYSRFGPSNMP